ncbi:MAG: PilN domain-containing protein, partial [Deltaproteobacteria bacterium]|nr:PilN domain-containing protein [Deltaproteobacteria bacterium]
KLLKTRLFKILNTIFRINSNYQASNPHIPVQMGWVCGIAGGLDEVASALKEAMGVEVAIAPAMPTGLTGESEYVPLAGFAAALQSGTATSYSAADIFRRFPLRKKYGLIIYAITSLAALLAISLSEREYRKLFFEVQRTQLAVNPKQKQAKAAASAAYTKNLETLKNLTSRQFVFYDLFRELANDLPDGVFLENLEFHLKEDKGLLDITAITRLSDKTGEGILLNKLMGMIDHSPILKNHREPSISVVSKEKERYMKITVTSEVSPLDTKK